MTTAFLHDEQCLWHCAGGPHALFLPVGGWVQPPAGGGHAESPESKRRMVSLLQVSGLMEELALRSAPLASDEALRRVHPSSYLEKFKALSDAGGGEVGFVAPFGPGSYEIARRSAGLALTAVDEVLKGSYRNAYAMSRPPGHHCQRDQAMGFCLLANIAIAVEEAIARHRLERVLVLDWDVHHGNGTQAIFYERPDVYTISIHQEHCFPPGYSGFDERGAGKGAGYNLNIPLQPGAGHDAYLYAFERIVRPQIERYRPQLIVVASGLDANAVDPLARLQATSETFRELTRGVMALADAYCGGRLVVVHEGGYAEAYVPFCGLAVVETLAGVRTQVADPCLEIFVPQQPGARFNAFQRELIDEMAAALAA
ncbi:MAG: class II histone deacetylase [Ideonella sp.]|nr:class II histone deacetylase [Ideonella sp.]MCC7456639.1 class II histone deacetylase [Nitrospira sp.]